jgi:hypothetical protein
MMFLEAETPVAGFTGSAVSKALVFVCKIQFANKKSMTSKTKSCFIYVLAKEGN